MLHANSMKTVMGGLSLLLVLSACAGSKSRTASDQSGRSHDVTTDRRTVDHRATSTDPTDRMSRMDQMATERPVPSDRLGTGDRNVSGQTSDRTMAGGRAADRVVPCADAKGDMTASSDCIPMNRDRDADRRFDDRGLAAACPSHRDAQGNVIYDDPSCADRYRAEHAGLAAACASHKDEHGKVVYDDPNCPTRSQRPMGSSYENIRWTQESAFFDRNADKAVKHAREAEIAGNQGHGPEMLRHAGLALDSAKEAQRAGRHPDLDAGIQNLRQAIMQGHGNQVAGATSTIRDARMKLSRAAGIKPADTRAPGERATMTNASSGLSTRTVRGELFPDRNTTTTAGGERFILRDQQDRETPISLSRDMSQQVSAGDTVEAQIDSNGQVVGITKAQ